MIGHTDVDGAAVVVEPCAESIASGDGRELWQYLPSGQIASVTGKKCIAVGTGNAVTLKNCDASSSSQWEAQGSGTRSISYIALIDICLLHLNAFVEASCARVRIV